MNNKILKELEKLMLKAQKKNEIPVAAIIVFNGKIISKAYNKRNISKNVLDHAEIIAIRRAARKIHDWRLNKCTLFVTIEPCDMCKSVINECRIENVVYLYEKPDYKKQFYRTKYKVCNISDLDVNILENITKISNNFWKKRR